MTMDNGLARVRDEKKVFWCFEFEIKVFKRMCDVKKRSCGVHTKYFCVDLDVLGLNLMLRAVNKMFKYYY